MSYLTASPLGTEGVITGGSALIEPDSVFNENPVTLLDALFEVKRNWPVLPTLGCSAIATGCDPVGRLAGVSAVNVPAAAAILYPKTWLVSWHIT